MNREILSPEALAAWITDRLQQIAGYEKCSVRGIFALEEPAADGCNWSWPFTLNCDNPSPQNFLLKLSKIVADARRIYNVG